jgi:PTH2 family peptidyl-tRNA hydrolase
MDADEHDIKQVIIIRKDLKMRRGKEIAQGSHASLAWLARRVAAAGLRGDERQPVQLSEPEILWLEKRFKKVCLQVSSEDALRDVHRRAREAGLEAHLIIDAGHTEFHGTPTPTSCAIGPDHAAKIDAITGTLALY